MLRGPDSEMRKLLGLTLRRLAADRRGVTALVFAVSAVAVLGLVGLGAEAGTWYLEKRHGQNAADAAAIAGALALAAGQDPGVSGIAAAAANGESNVLITLGVFSAPATFTRDATPANAVQAVVTTSATPLFSAVFLGQQQVRQGITISETAVAMVTDTPACILAGSSPAGAGVGTLELDADVQGDGNCVFASNGTSYDAIKGSSASTVSAGQSLVSSGGCYGCTASALTYQPQTADPFAQAIAGFALPTSTQCSNNSPPLPSPAINCGLSLSGSGNSTNLSSGTYIFYGPTGISVTNYAAMNCSACTIITTGISVTNHAVMTCSPCTLIVAEIQGTISGIDIENSTIDLTSQTTSDVFNGVLFYIDQPAASSSTVTISDNTGPLGGVMYFPTSTVTFGGNGSSQPCSVIIAANLIFTGDSAFSRSGCPADTVPRTHPVRLVM